MCTSMFLVYYLISSIVTYTFIASYWGLFRHDAIFPWALLISHLSHTTQDLVVGNSYTCTLSNITLHFYQFLKSPRCSHSHQTITQIYKVHCM